MKILLGVLVVLVVGLALMPLPVQAACTGSTPTLSAPDTGNAATNGANLAACLTAAACGTTITLTHGATYQAGSGSSFTLGAKGDCSATPIVVTTDGTLPTTKTACTDPGESLQTVLCPTRDAGQLAKIISDASASRVPAFVAANSANGWTLRGLEVVDPGANGALFTNFLIDLTAPSGTYADLLATKNFTLDRTWVHAAVVAIEGGAADNTAQSGINVSGQNVTISKSYIAGFGGVYPTGSTRTNSYGINMGAGGPSSITDNYIEALFNNIFIVGAIATTGHTATISVPTTTSATFSVVTDLQVGDYVALEVDNAVALTVTDGATSGAGSTTLTSAAAGFTAGMVGQSIYFTAGSNFNLDGGGGAYIITTFNSSSSVVLDRSPTPSGAGSGGTGDVRNCHDPVALALPCWQSAAIDTINGGTGAVTYHAIGPTLCQTSGVFLGACALRVTPKNGGSATWRGLHPHDITVQRNMLYKKPWWQSSATLGGGAKDYIEIKQIQSSLVQGNIFKGACSTGATPEVSGSGANNSQPWSTADALTVRDNLYYGLVASPGWIIDNSEQTDTPPTNIKYINNLMTHVPGWCPPKGSPNAHRLDSGFIPVANTGGSHEISHNTFRYSLDDGTGDVMTDAIKGATGGPGANAVIYRDNVADYSFFGLNTPTTRADVFPNFVEDHNVLNMRLPKQAGRNECFNGTEVSGDGSQIKQFPNSCGTTPAGNAADDTVIKFANATACDDGSDYHGCGLASDSPFKGKASDSTDPGVNLTTLDAALAGGATPPPPATPPGHKFKMKRH